MHLACKSHTTVPSNNTSPRNILLDILRGTVMLLVILQHTKFPFGGVILAFHMPMLFLLSGYTKEALQIRENGFWSSLVKKAKRLLVPYLVFEAINLIGWIGICLVTQRDMNLASALLNILLCRNTAAYTGLIGRLWFLPCIFLADVLCGVLRKYLSLPYKIIATVALFLAAWAIAEFVPVKLPFCLDSAILGAAYIMLGGLGKKVVDVILYHKNHLFPILSIPVFGVAFVLCIGNGRSYLSMDAYAFFRFPLAILGSICGSLTFIAVIRYVGALLQLSRHATQAISWFSLHSIAVYVVHIDINWCLGQVLEKLQAEHWLISFVLVIVLSVPVIAFINFLCPWVVGEKRQTKRKNSIS